MRMKLGLVFLVVAPAMFVSVQGATSASGRPVVRVTILPNLNLTFAPSTVKRGTVVFQVTNHSGAAHEFSIDGVTSSTIGPHKTASVKVTFKRAARYTATLADCGYLSMCAGDNPDLGPTGLLKVT